jgi:hypothetical protein
MMSRSIAGSILILSLAGFFQNPKNDSISPSIDQREFRALFNSLSEPEGYFDSDNFISNERSYLKILPELKQLVTNGSAYIGVGPDQNYSYIAAVRPQLAFIIDIRRQNALQHFYLKALFQLSDSRALYLQKLFGRQFRLSGQEANQNISDLLHLIDSSRSDADFEKKTTTEAINVIRSWDSGLTEEDYASIQRAARAFIDSGPDLKFNTLNRAPREYYPSYRQLMEETDSQGRQCNYLASENTFQYVKKLHRENRIVPIVGDLAGTHAVIKIGEELRHRGLVLACFYVSNVEFYLFGSERWNEYTKNLARIPRDPNACLVRTYAKAGQQYLSIPDYYMGVIIQSLQSFLNDESAGRNKNYRDLVSRGLVVR